MRPAYPGLHGKAVEAHHEASSVPTTTVTLSMSSIQTCSMQAVLPPRPPTKAQALEAASPAVHSVKSDQSDGGKQRLARQRGSPAGGGNEGRHGVASASDWSGVVGDGDR
jgi:hypothetical protein